MLAGIGNGGVEQGGDDCIGGGSGRGRRSGEQALQGGEAAFEKNSGNGWLENFRILQPGVVLPEGGFEPGPIAEKFQLAGDGQ